jgi:hypothetical protein
MASNGGTVLSLVLLRCVYHSFQTFACSLLEIISASVTGVANLFAVDVGMEVVGSCGGVLPALRCRSQGTPPWVRGQLMEGRRSLQVLVRYSSRRRQH